MVRPLQPLSEVVDRKFSFIGFVQKLESQNQPKIWPISELQVRQHFYDFTREEGKRVETGSETGNKETKAGAIETEAKAKYEEKVGAGDEEVGAGEEEVGAGYKR